MYSKFKPAAKPANAAKKIEWHVVAKFYKTHSPTKFETYRVERAWFAYKCECGPFKTHRACEHVAETALMFATGKIPHAKVYPETLHFTVKDSPAHKAIVATLAKIAQTKVGVGVTPATPGAKAEPAKADPYADCTSQAQIHDKFQKLHPAQGFLKAKPEPKPAVPAQPVSWIDISPAEIEAQAAKHLARKAKAKAESEAFIASEKAKIEKLKAAKAAEPKDAAAELAKAGKLAIEVD